MHKVMQNKLTKSLIILPIFGIIILSFLYINIYVEGALMNSSAINDTDSYSFNLTDTTNLSISLPAPESLTLTPSAEGVFGSKSIAVGVSTNSPYGYTLTMSAASSSLSRSAAVGGITPTIPALETAVSEADFPNNYWGFKRTSTAIADTNYQPMLANHSVLVNNTSANADSSSSTITFGVKLSNETPSGDYSINIDFLAVTNVAPNLYYMQDATSTSLAAAMPSVGDTTVLYDRRDNKEYTIAKLADGKYWMTKNLDLDGGTPLYSSDSDVPAGYDVEPYYTLPASQKITSGTTLDGGFNDNAGEYVFNSSNKTDSCSSGCYSYYSYNAATAMSGTSISTDNTDAPYSICPAGWRLPTSRNTVELATGTPGSDFYKMAINYGLDSTKVDEDPDNEPKFCNLGGDCSTNTVPRFLRAGNYDGSTFYSGGTGGRYWSSTASSSASARNLGFYSGDVYSANNTNRRYGFSVRCLFDATMQNFTSEDADAMALHQEEVLVDARDGKNYYVTKLKDGNVWMTQNLDLDLSTSTTFTHADTDLGWTNLDTNATWTPTRSTIDSTSYGNITTCSSESSTGTGCWGRTNTGFTSISGTNLWDDDPNTPYSVNPGYRYMTFTDRTTENDYWYSNGDTFANCSTQDTNCGGQGHYMIGNYYNFAAANATNSVNDTVGHTVTDSDANFVMPNSICPKGWRMPKGQPSNKEFAALFTTYNIYGDGAMAFNYQGLNAMRRDPLYFVRSGHVSGGTLLGAGTSGGVWSNTMGTASNGRGLDFYGDSIYTNNNLGRNRGYPVRCLLRTE